MINSSLELVIAWSMEETAQIILIVRCQYSGLARAIVLDYNPDNGDTISGQCKIINTIGDPNSGSIPEINPAS